MRCKYHPNRETNVSCNSCGEGLCPECMVYSPVGQKCRDCARPSKGMLRHGKPSQYIGALVAGIAASLVGGLVLTFLFRGWLVLNILLGILIGEAVKRGARGNRGPVFAVIAAASTILGLTVAGYALTPMGLIFTLVIAGVAAYRLNN